MLCRQRAAVNGWVGQCNFRLRLDSTPEFIVLRICEHDAFLSQKELDLLGLLAGSVPVPEVPHAAPCGWGRVGLVTFAVAAAQ